jgi:hypothetical protein
LHRALASAQSRTARDRTTSAAPKARAPCAGSFCLLVRVHQRLTHARLAGKAFFGKCVPKKLSCVCGL